MTGVRTVGVMVAVTCLVGCGNWFRTRQECVTDFQREALQACYDCVDDGGVYNKSVSKCEGGVAARQQQARARQRAIRRAQAAQQAAHQQELERQRAYDAETARRQSAARPSPQPERTTQSAQQPAEVSVSFTGERTLAEPAQCDEAIANNFSQEPASDRAEALRQCRACFNDSPDPHLWKLVLRDSRPGGYYCIARDNLH